MKNKKVIYTAIFGGYDSLNELPIKKLNGFDFICFTDMDIKSDTWKIIKVEPSFSDSTRNARMYKILPHKFLNEYEISIWIDGNILVKKNPDRLIKKYLNDCNLAIYNHAKNKQDPRNCVYKEAEVLLYEINVKGKKKDNPKIIKAQIERYKKAGYPENNTLAVSMIVFRRHNEEDVIKAMNSWWHELKNNSKRDQLSFNFVMWKNKFKFNYIKGDSRKNWYFKCIPHQAKKF